MLTNMLLNHLELIGQPFAIPWPFSSPLHELFLLKDHVHMSGWCSENTEQFTEFGNIAFFYLVDSFVLTEGYARNKSS